MPIHLERQAQEVRLALEVHALQDGHLIRYAKQAGELDGRGREVAGCRPPWPAAAACRP